MRIAIVDDDPIVCQSLETILTATGTAEVLWMANDGDAAVRRYFETPASRPDVLLIDIQMPGTSGLDAAREILATDPAARILFLTTFADLRELRMNLYLVDCRGYSRFRDQPLQVIDLEVRNPHGTCCFVILEL